MTKTRLSAGQNVQLPAAADVLTLTVTAASGAVGPPDLFAFLLTAAEVVRADDDVVFYNQPEHSSAAVVLAAPGEPLAIRIVLRRLPPDVHKVVLAIASDDGPLLPGVVLALSDESGQVGLVATTAGGGGEQALVLVEVYRRNGVWRVRFVDQGWGRGLVALLEEFGVTVDADADTAATAVPESGKTGSGPAVRAHAAAGPSGVASAPADTHEVASLRSEADELRAELFTLRRQVREVRSELVQTDEFALLQEVGYYQFSHPLDHAAKYRERLDKLRTKIKAALRDKTAVRSAPGWTVNGSAKDGAALVRYFSTLMLRTYNVEVDNCVRTVRLHTLDTVTRRLDRARDAILKLGAMMAVSIDDGYHEMRVRELRLTTDFQAKLEQEKEQVRADRERLREDAKALAELQREESRLLKERSHYQTVLDRLTPDDAPARERVQAQLDAIAGGLAGVRSREANTRAGYVYVISNPGAFGELIVKIGMTRRLDPMDRVHELGNASVPFRYDVHALIFSDDAVGLEVKLHAEFNALRVNRVNLRREFFQVSPAEVREALLRIGRDHVLEYHEAAEALEWRQSLALAGADARLYAGAGPAGGGVRLRAGSSA